MKKIERLHHEERNGDYRREISSIDSIIDTVNSLVDAHNELLETHTVKEEKEILLGEDKSDGVHVKLFGYRKDGGVYVTREEVKEEPTTPEIIITGLQYKVVSQPTTPEKIYCGKVTHPFFCECKPTIPEKKHGKGLCTTYHPDDCCTMNPKCDFYEPPKPTTPEKNCCELCECASYVDGVKTKSKCNSKDCPCHQGEKRNDVY